MSALSLYQQTSVRFVTALRALQTAAVGMGVAFAAWYPGHWLAILLVMPWIWSQSYTRLRAFALWFAYYMAASRDIPSMCANFFVGTHEASGSAAFAMGVAFWISSSALLALPWGLLARRGFNGRFMAGRAVLATALVTLPPLGVIGWVSPIHAASALYPGWGLAGLGLGLLAIAAATMADERRGLIALGILAALSIVANGLHVPPNIPSGWVGLNTKLGIQSDADYPALYARTQDVQNAVSRAFARGATVVVAPESVAGPWRPSAQSWWQNYSTNLRTNGKSLLLGVEIEDTDTLLRSGDVRYVDAVVAIGASRGAFASRQPMPVGSWRPGASATAVVGSLSQHFVTLGGLQAAISICYEDMLWWPHWRALIQKPDVIVSVANNWFIAGTALEAIQAQSIASIARLVDRPLVRARND